MIGLEQRSLKTGTGSGAPRSELLRLLVLDCSFADDVSCGGVLCTFFVVGALVAFLGSARLPTGMLTSSPASVAGSSSCLCVVRKIVVVSDSELTDSVPDNVISPEILYKRRPNRYM